MRLDRLRSFLCMCLVVMFSLLSFAQHRNASIYAHKFIGHKTASGDPYDPQFRTAAHRTLPFGTILELTNPANGHHSYAIVNDRGPWITGRDLDLSEAVARDLGMGHTAHITYKIFYTPKY